MKNKRILLKLSGEYLARENGMGIDFEKMLNVADVIKECVNEGYEIAIVVGGGNFWRGRSNTMMDSTTSDHIGMLGTTMNALALNDAFLQTGVESRVQTSIEMRQISELYIRNRALKHLDKKRVVIFACGTGNPYFSTDTTAALRAAEIGADVIFKATNVDGVYDSDPKLNPNAVRYDEISLAEVVEKRLHVMDTTAAAMCLENDIPIFVFNLNDPDNIVRAVQGEKIGTIVK